MELKYIILGFIVALSLFMGLLWALVTFIPESTGVAIFIAFITAYFTGLLISTQED